MCTNFVLFIYKYACSVSIVLYSIFSFYLNSCFNYLELYFFFMKRVHFISNLKSPAKYRIYHPNFLLLLFFFLLVMKNETYMYDIT